MDYARALLYTATFSVRALFAWGLWSQVCPALGSPAKEGAILVGILVAIEFVWGLAISAFPREYRR